MDITGTPGNDTLTGTSGNDIIDGLGGNDLIQGLEGNDDLRGGDGNDLLNGGAGDDVLRGQAGSDILNGGEGTDYIYASSGDTVDGGSGNDYLYLDLSAETSDLTISYTDPANGTVSNGTSFQAVEDIDLFSGSGNDSITLSAVSVNVTSYGQVAVVLGGAGNDTITGSNFDDYLEGQAGNDILNSAAGNDDLRGGDGNDILNGVNPNSPTPGLGERDNLSGGTGADRFILGDAANIYYDDRNTTTNGGNDYATITDFNPSQDKVQLQGVASSYRLEISGANTNLYIDKAGSEPDELIRLIRKSQMLTVNGFC